MCKKKYRVLLDLCFSITESMLFIYSAFYLYTKPVHWKDSIAHFFNLNNSDNKVLLIIHVFWHVHNLCYRSILPSKIFYKFQSLKALRYYIIYMSIILEQVSLELALMLRQCLAVVYRKWSLRGPNRQPSALFYSATPLSAMSYAP